MTGTYDEVEPTYAVAADVGVDEDDDEPLPPPPSPREVSQLATMGVAASPAGGFGVSPSSSFNKP